ncbi:alpha/beta fold hydrolase [Corynebacterium breve]|uniref:Alpha/beta fold hydrolase n=1 Tax=Corynebacterium breve TaxID=3049799 RepID=A0ABY8VJN4_9CORY|nr:alpha/beta hydrolase [Corynebacterium breve]WIM67790.1 alpha/beta fold hydrolase [Corynebacterium breve]
MRRRTIAVIGLVLAALVCDRLAIALTADPDVGHFLTSEGHSNYVHAYEAALAEGPAPELTTDIPTTFGTAHVHGWNLNATSAPIVLVPGRASGAPMWNELIPALPHDRPIYALDAIGDAGLSTQSVPLTSMEDQATWLADVIRGLDIRQAHVVGHSFGGATATALAQHHPELVETLTLLEPAFVFAYPPASVFFWGSVIVLPLPQTWIDRGLAEIGGTTIDDVRRRTPISEMIDAGAQHYSAALPTPTPLSDDALHKLDMPVYVGVADTKSLAGGEKAVQRASSLLPQPTVKLWENTTHSLPFQVAYPIGAELQIFWAEAELST